jgi:fructose-bisphosphate aldolase class II
VEGELVAVGGVEDGIGSDKEGDLLPIEKEIEFIRATGIYCYAPPIGTAHGFYKAAPTIRYDRMQQLVEATQMPMVLHGGSGLTNDVFKRLISLGAAKVNISTDLKKTFADGFRNYLEQRPTEYNPLKLIGAVRGDVEKMAQTYFKIFGSEGKV